MNPVSTFIRRFWVWLGGAVGILVFAPKLGSVVDWLRSTLAEGVTGTGPTLRLSASVGWLVLVGLIFLLASFGGLGILWKQLEAQLDKLKRDFETQAQEFETYREKANKTLMGMMDAGTRIVHQLYPLADRPPYVLERVVHEYYIEADGTAQVEVKHCIRAHEKPLHFWRIDFAAQPAATPMPFLIDLDFRVWDVQNPDRVTYLVIKNDPYAKELSVFFLPFIAPGEKAREICYSFRWPKMVSQLLHDGSEDFGFRLDSRQKVQQLGIAVLFSDAAHQEYELSCSLTGAHVPGQKLTEEQKSPDWKGWRYQVNDGPAEGFPYMIRFQAAARHG